MKHTYFLELGRQLGTNTFKFLWLRTYENAFDFRYDITIIKGALEATGMFERIDEYENENETFCYIILK